jgi:hypothetical protein
LLEDAGRLCTADVKAGNGAGLEFHKRLFSGSGAVVASICSQAPTEKFPVACLRIPQVDAFYTDKLAYGLTKNAMMISL